MLDKDEFFKIFKNSIICTERDHTIRVFLSGDYEFLSRMYGLSWVSGMLKLIYIYTS